MPLPEPKETSVSGSTVDQADQDQLLAFFASVAGSRQIGDVPGREDLRRDLGDPGPSVHDLVWSGADLVGYAALSKRDATDETRDLSLSLILRPDCRTTRMREEVRRWLGSRTRRISTSLPHSPDLRIYASTQRHDRWAAGLVNGCGFRMECAFADMSVTLSTSVHQSDHKHGHHVVRFSSPFAEAVRVAYNEAFDGHWGTTPWWPQLREDDVMGDPDFLPHLFLMTTSPGKTVEAFVLTSDAMLEGQAGHTIHIDLVGTRKTSRGSGLATRLLHHTLRSALVAGYGEATLAVDTDGGHGALSMYQRLGFEIADESLYWCSIGPPPS